MGQTWDDVGREGFKPEPEVAEHRDDNDQAACKCPSCLHYEKMNGLPWPPALEVKED